MGMYIQRIYCSCINDERTLVGVDIFNSMFDILDIVIVGRGFPEDTLCLSISAAIDHISTIRMHAHANTSTTPAWWPAATRKVRRNERPRLGSDQDTPDVCLRCQASPYDDVHHLFICDRNPVDLSRSPAASGRDHNWSLNFNPQRPLLLVTLLLPVSFGLSVDNPKDPRLLLERIPS